MHGMFTNQVATVHKFKDHGTLFNIWLAIVKLTKLILFKNPMTSHQTKYIINDYFSCSVFLEIYQTFIMYII